MSENESWEEMKGNSGIWQPKIGESVEGIIISMTQGAYGLQCDIETKAGVVKTPSNKVLVARLHDCKIGDFIKIIYEKDELPTIKGNKPTKIFSVKRKVLDIKQEKV